MLFMETAFNQLTGNYRLMKAKISVVSEANTDSPSPHQNISQTWTVSLFEAVASNFFEQIFFGLQ